jgi:cysteinyl-tRNA synthetase
MQLYNSLTARKEEFAMPHDRPVSLYVCGVTPYDTAHIGHARTFMTFDVLIRYLHWKGARVRYVQNVTDVDDPLFERARRDGVDWRDLARDQVARFQADNAALNIQPPDVFPWASEEIPTMIPIIECLIELGHAYVREGNVYFSVRSDPQFGAMARMDYDEMLEVANQRGNNPEDSRKVDPLDFVLWQTGNPGDPTWDSPWGPGRPGWHIECSAMSTRYLGDQIDIHGGGRDLLFPHHPCEIAQTEPFTGHRPFARFWMHCGLVWLDGEKMSKSLGNLIFTRDALKLYSANTIRWYLLTTRYREDFSYERKAVPEAAHAVERLTMALRERSGNGPALDLNTEEKALDEALGDDLDTPLALQILHSMANAIHVAAATGRNILAAQEKLRDSATVLGFQV